MATQTPVTARVRLIAPLVGVLLLLLAACGDDDDASSRTTERRGGTSTTAADDSDDGTGGDSDEPTASDDDTTVPTSAVETTTTTAPATTTTTPVPLPACPSQAIISQAAGQQMVLAANPSEGVCQYVFADGSGGLTVNVGFNRTNLTTNPPPTREQLAGLGQAALWGGGELVVWNGTYSLVVTVLAQGQGPEFDDRALAIDIATAILSGL